MSEPVPTPSPASPGAAFIASMMAGGPAPEMGVTPASPAPGVPPAAPGVPPAAPGMPSPEPGVVPAPGAGASFLRELFASQPGALPQVPIQAPVPPAAPGVPPPPPPVQPQAPVPPPQPVDFSSRYSGQQAQPQDPLAGLQELPDLAPEQPVAQPQDMNPQQGHAWAALRAQSAANRRTAEEFRAKYNQVVESTKKFQAERTEFGEQLNHKDAEIKALQDELGRIDLTRSPAFREKYDAPIQAVHKSMAETLVANGMAQAEAEKLAADVLTADPNSRPELMGQLPTYVQGMLMVKATEGDGLYAARDSAISDWRASAEGLAAVQERAGSLVNAQHIDKMANAAIEIVRGMPIQTKAPAYQVTDPEFVADRDAKERQFRAWVQQAPEEQKYAAMLEGYMAPKTYEMLEHTMRENIALRQALASRSRLASPPLTPSAPYVPPPAPPPAQPAPTFPTAGFSPAPTPGMDAQSFVQAAWAQAQRMVQQ